MGWSWPGNRQASSSGAALLIIQALTLEAEHCLPISLELIRPRPWVIAAQPLRNGERCKVPVPGTATHDVLHVRGIC